MKFRREYVPIRRSPEHNWLGAVMFTVRAMHDEVNEFGDRLMQQFPTGLFISPDHYYNRTIPRGAEGKTHATFPTTIIEAGEANNSAECFFRVPWPEDLASGDPNRLLGVESISSSMDDRTETRRLGRHIRFTWSSHPQQTTKLVLKKARDRVACDCTIHLVGEEFAVNATYNKEDPDILQFLKQVEDLLLQFTSCDFASYDPCTGATINANRRDASRRRTEGVVRYAALNDRAYFGFCNRRDADWEVMGPRPEVRAAFRREAGLED